MQQVDFIVYMYKIFHAEMLVCWFWNFVFFLNFLLVLGEDCKDRWQIQRDRDEWDQDARGEIQKESVKVKKC